MAVRRLKVTSFTKGLVTIFEPKSISRGAASYSRNFVTKGDKIEIRRGYQIIGSEVIGTGRVTGIATPYDAIGNQKIFYSHGKKVKSFNDGTDDFVELGTDILTAAADGEDIAFSSYASLSGYQLFFSSPNSSIYKVMVSNPTDYADLYDAAKNHKGKISIKQNRMTLWGRAKDKTGVYMSYIDDPQYTTVTAEVIGTHNGVLLTFANTLTFKAGGAKRACFAITVTDGVETFADNYDGT
jgi:hypothetical protein